MQLGYCEHHFEEGDSKSLPQVQTGDMVSDFFNRSLVRYELDTGMCPHNFLTVQSRALD